jgi:hypothetical protein
MRSKIVGFILGCGLTMAAMAPAAACHFQSTDASDQSAQQTAQAQPLDPAYTYTQ